MGMCRPPVARDIDPPCQPDAVVPLHMVEELHQPGKPRRPADKPAMQPHRQHFRRRLAFGIERVESVDQIGGELVAGMEPLRRREAHVVGVERIGDDQVRALGLGAPERKIVRIIVGVIEEPAFGGDKPPRVLGCPSGVPAERAFAADAAVDLDGALKMLRLLGFAHAVIIDPAIAVRGDFMAVRQRPLDHRRMAFHRHRHGKQRQRHAAVAEQVEETPHAGTRAIFIDRFHRHVARALERRRADDLGQEHFGCRIAVEHRVLGAFLVIQHELDGDPGVARPARMRRRGAVADHVARIAHPASPSGTPSLRSIARHFASIARSSGSTQITLPGGIACETADCQ